MIVNRIYSSLYVLDSGLGGIVPRRERWVSRKLVPVRFDLATPYSPAYTSQRCNLGGKAALPSVANAYDATHIP